MSTREVTLFNTPSGKPLEIKTYITARERNALRAVFLESMQIDPMNPTAPKIQNLSAQLIEKGEHKAIEIAVQTYDGSSENVVDRLLDNPAGPADYDFVVAAAQKVANLGPAK